MATINKETSLIPFLFMGCWGVPRLIEKENHCNVSKNQENIRENNIKFETI